MSDATKSRPVATGGLLFAATIMILAGLFQFFQGIIAIAKDDLLVATPNYLFRFNVTTWGWIHLIIGLLVMVVGFFVYTKAVWARGIAIFLVALQAFSNFFFLPYYPLWALTLVALDIFVIWALTVAPGRSRADDGYIDTGADDTYQAAQRATRGM
jgi:hypothetical protein